MSGLTEAAHGVIVLALGVVVVMLRQQTSKKANGAGDLYKRIEEAERRLSEKLDIVLTQQQPRGKR